MRIVIFAALPQEYRPFQKRMGRWRRLARQPVRLFRHAAADGEILLVETGMGSKQLQEAFTTALQAGRADLILATGFAGSLWQGFQVGQVLLGGRLASCNLSSPPLVVEAFRFHPSPGLAAFCTAHHIETARIITVEQPQDKSRLAFHSAGTASVMDMESAHLAQLAFDHSIPFLALRAVSDALQDAIDYSLEEIADRTGRVRIRLVLLAILRKPLLCRSFALSWWRARKAAQHLARTLGVLLATPHPVLSTIIKECRMLPVSRQQDPRP
jgi:adenosylhomocysteine nucleosidase